MRALLLSLTSALLVDGMAQGFARKYGHPLNYPSHAMAASTDAYYLLHGSENDGFDETELIKTDLDGEVLWSRALNVIPGRLAVGEGAVYLTTNSPVVMKLDTAGDLLWSSSFYCGELAYVSRLHPL